MFENDFKVLKECVAQCLHNDGVSNDTISKVIREVNKVEELYFDYETKS